MLIRCKLEIVKLLRAPAILGFLGVCLIVNTVVILTNSYKEEIDYINDVGETTGWVYGTEYRQKLQTVPVPDELEWPESWNHENIVRGAEGTRNVFAELDTDELFAQLHDESAPYSSLTRKILRMKYDLLTPVIKQKAASDEGSSVYFGAQTGQIHEAVFGIIGTLLAVECCIFFVLFMLWALGFETMAGTGLVTFATKTGRRQVFHKVAAALVMGTGFFIIIHAAGYGLTFFINDYSEVWGQNISAQYHTIYDNYLGSLPFITWGSMSIGGYFFAFAGVSLLNGLVSALIAIPFGLLIKNVYLAFCSVAGMAFLHLVFYLFFLNKAYSGAPGAIPFLWNLSLIFPLTQIFNTGLWFSDGGMLMLLPRFEVFYPLICMLLLCPVLIVCGHKFKRKEIA